MEKFVVLLLVTVCTLNGCKSTNGLDKDIMYSMVYDLENVAVQDVEFFLDDELIGKSDINGRFLIDCLKEGDKENHHLRLVKYGYEELKDEIQFQNSMVLYYKIGSAEQYTKICEKALDERDFEKALNQIEKALLLEPTEERIYLKAIVLKKLNRMEEMEVELLKIKKIPEDSPFKSGLRG